ncbi:MAG: orotidine 5'-phosphate decarboxylase [Candidatus Hodarchaeales archaeon]|jgi:orotidine-5'-phosphate decarboxylase
MVSIKSWLEKRVKNGSGRIVWAFDPKLHESNPFKKCSAFLDEIAPLIAGIKFNRQLILPYGLQNKDLAKLIARIHNLDIPLIMDAKVNDIGYTNQAIASLYFSAGFDALIVNPMIGSDAIEPIVSVAEENMKDVLFLVYMSHPSARFGYGRNVQLHEDERNISELNFAPFYHIFASKVNKWNVAGCIVGGTVPDIIRKVRSFLDENKLIFSPGIGSQGGSPLEARNAGMDYAIIGRTITQSENPFKTVDILKDALSS